MIKPEIEDVAKWYIEGDSSLYYDGQNLKSNQNGKLIFTINDEKYWEWSGSSWSQQTVSADEKNPDGSPVNTIDRRITNSAKTFTYTVDAVVNAIDEGEFESINPNKIETFNYDTNSIKTKDLTFQNIAYSYLGKDYLDTLGSNFSLSTSNHRTSSGVVFDFSKPTFVGVKDNSSVTLSNVVTENGVNFASPLSAISINYSRTTKSRRCQLRIFLSYNFSGFLFGLKSYHN